MLGAYHKRDNQDKEENCMILGDGNVWKNLRNQPMFTFMNVLSIFYMILSAGVNSYLY